MLHDVAAMLHVNTLHAMCSFKPNEFQSVFCAEGVVKAKEDLCKARRQEFTALLTRLRDEFNQYIMLVLI